MTPDDVAVLKRLQEEIAWLAESVEHTVADWYRAKDEGKPFPGTKYGRELAEYLRKLHDTVGTARARVGATGHADLHARLTEAMRRFRDDVGVSEDELKWADNAVGHPEGSVAGGKASVPFGGTVQATTHSARTFEVDLRGPVDLFVSLSGPNRTVEFSALRAKAAARHLGDEAVDVMVITLARE